MFGRVKESNFKSGIKYEIYDLVTMTFKKNDHKYIIYSLAGLIFYGENTESCIADYNKIAKDIVAIEFWAGWNESNQFNELNKLNDCNVYRIDIMSYMDIQNEYNVTAIPTVIIFDNGIEKARFDPNIMFQLA